MKIALPARNDLIDDHFGHCEYFTVFTIDTNNKTIVSQENVSSPEGCGCKSNIASVLADMGVTLLLAGNMGPGAVSVLNNSGIEVIRGCSGNLQEVAIEWLQGTIADSGLGCQGHDCNH